MNTPKSINPEELQRQLASFSGSLEYHRLTASIQPEILWTDGCAYLAEQARCYWLLDAIASHQTNPRVRQEPFQIWTLQIGSRSRAKAANPEAGRAGRPKPMATLSCRTDSGPGNLLVTQRITFTDFPLESIKLYVVQGGGDGAALNFTGMLPSEY